MSYKLYYWPDIPGRGEFVRLALEEAGAHYRDTARTAKGMAEMQAMLGDDGLSHRPFAPPFLVDGDIIIGQTAAILLYLGDKHELAPRTRRNAFGRIRSSSPSPIWSPKRMIRITRLASGFITRTRSMKQSGAPRRSARSAFPNS